MTFSGRASHWTCGGALALCWGSPFQGYLREETFWCGGQRHTVKVYRSENFAKALGLAAGQTEPAFEFVLVPGGAFSMGSPGGEAGRGSEEGPQHQVNVKPFLMARTELTQGVWERVMGSNPARFKGAKRPVEKVSWHGVQTFCKRTGLRLPTEAEWEYACRGGTTTEYCFGDGESGLGRYAWFKQNAGSTHEVGSKKPNAFGLFDVHGNVWEWTESLYEAGAPSRSSAWGDPAGASKRVIRGGGWGHSARGCRSAVRRRGVPGVRGIGLGFRPARSLR